MDPLNSVLFVDNSTILPNTLFKKLDRAWCTLFVQDAKLDMAEETMKTCEFGLGLSSQWGNWNDRYQIFENVAEVLNTRVPRIWLMATKEVLVDNVKQKGDQQAVWPVVQRALKKNKSNILEIDNPLEKKTKFPTPFDEKSPFNPHKMSTYYAIGLTPYQDMPIEHFADITGKYPKNPRILMIDGGVTGPVQRVCNYKHITRLVMNGTAAADQNPSYVIVETKYSNKLASFLKKKFPQDTKLVIKHVASTRGEGIAMVDASSEKVLDDVLKNLLSENSEFKNRNPLSICIIESFVSTPAETSLEKTQETIVRVVNLVFKDDNKIEYHPIAASRCFEDSKSHKDKSTVGMVKLGKFNDGRFVSFNQDQLAKIREKHFKEISAFAERAVSYDSDAAVEYFLSSENPILNLVGVELFSPILSANYRESHDPAPGRGCSHKRMKETHCHLLVSLLKKNKSQILRERILENILLPEIREMYGNPMFQISENFTPLFLTVCAEAKSSKSQILCREALIQNYINLSCGLFLQTFTFDFTLKAINLTSNVEDLNRRLRLASSYHIVFTNPRLMPRKEGVDYLSNLKQLKLEKIPTEFVKELTEVFLTKKDMHKFGYDFFRFFLRLQKEESQLTVRWEKSDWNLLLQIVKDAPSAADVSSFFWLLPEALHIGWKANQFIDILKSYNAKKGGQEALQFFGSIIRFLAQCTETQPDSAFQFIKIVSQFSPDCEQLMLLLPIIQKSTLASGMNINKVLANFSARMQKHQEENGSSIDSFKKFMSQFEQ